jgi:hypothetical protein
MLEHVNWVIVTLVLCTLLIAHELNALHSVLVAIHKSLTGIAEVADDERLVRKLRSRNP